jgi:hypothetical protein
MPRCALPSAIAPNECVGKSSGLAVENRFAGRRDGEARDIRSAGHDRGIAIHSDVHVGQDDLGKNSSFLPKVVEMFRTAKELTTRVYEGKLGVKEAADLVRIITLNGFGPLLLHVANFLRSI